MNPGTCARSLPCRERVKAGSSAGLCACAERRLRLRRAQGDVAGRKLPCGTAAGSPLLTARVYRRAAELRPTGTTMLKKFDKKDEESGEGA